MKLELHRDTFTEHSTIGKLRVNGVEYCNTLEDYDRHLEVSGIKIPGKTCIPRGTYVVTLDVSRRFLRLMPHLLDVPHFDGVRIHSGNTDADTEGCILVGYTRGTDFIGDSRKAFDDLFSELDSAILAGETIEITIT